ncbi:hypothetical protein QQ045_007075 [Rhodiola kirilowii]
MVALLSCLQSISTRLATISGEFTSPIRRENSVLDEKLVSRRRTLCSSTFVLSSVIGSLMVGRPRQVLAVELDEVEQEEDRVVNIFQESSQSVVFIKDLELPKDPSGASSSTLLGEDDNAVVEGTGSGFIWDKYGHIVTNYHVIAKLATDQYGRQRCKVYLVDTSGNSISREAKLVGFDASYDLAVLKVDVQGTELKPIVLGTSQNLRVGQSCFAIGNPYGYANTLTTGVVSGLSREIPSPNGGAIRGAIQTDAAINSGNSGGPLIDSYGHVIGVNTATFTRRGSGMSSGINFAIPIDSVVRTIPYLIIYGTPYSDRF